MNRKAQPTWMAEITDNGFLHIGSDISGFMGLWLQYGT